MSLHVQQLPQRAVMFALGLMTLVACQKEKFGSAATITGTTATTTGTAATTGIPTATTTSPTTTAGSFPQTGGGPHRPPPQPSVPAQPLPGEPPLPRERPLPGAKPLHPVRTPPLHGVSESVFPIRLVCVNPITIIDPVFPLLTDLRQIPVGQLVLRNLRMFKIMSDGEAVSAGASDVDAFAPHIDCGVVKIAAPGLPPIGFSARVALSEWTSFNPVPTIAIAAREIALKIENGRLIIARSVEVPTGVVPPTMQPMSYDQFARADGKIIWMRSYAPTPNTWDLRMRIDRMEPDGRRSSEYMRGLFELAHP